MSDLSRVDFTKFHVKGESIPRDAAENKPRWWASSDNQTIAQSIHGALDTIVQDQDSRIRQYIISTRLYGNLSVTGPGGVSFAKLSTTHPALKDKISYNVVQSATDTVVAKTTKSKPKPFFLTNGGNYRQQRKAKKLNKFVEGLFYEQDAYKKGENCMRDGCVLGDGLIHVYANANDRVAWERWLPHEVWVDDLEAFYGTPRTLHHCKNVDREELLQFVEELGYDKKLTKELKKAVEEAPVAKPDRYANSSTVSDLVQVCESWHLRSSPNSTDGRHAITLENATLLFEDYEEDVFPVARFSWCERMHGYWSQGLAEQLQNIQLEINKLMGIVQRSFHLGGTFKILLESGSKVVKEHLNNDVGALIMYSGTKPEYVVPPLVPPEIYHHLKTLRSAAYEQAGISQLSASSTLPQGVESGKAMRTLNNIEAERFISIGHTYERLYLQLARLSIMVAKQIAKRHKGHYTVKVPGQRYFQDLDWKDIDLEEDNYVMQVFPISSLPNEPAGRLQTVQEYIAAGFITPRQGKHLLDFPDLDTAEGLQAASEDYLTMILDKIIDEGEFTPPDQFDDLELGRLLALEYLQRGRASELEDEKQEMLLRFIKQIDARKKAALKEAQAQQAAQQAAAAPVAAPQAPPTPPQPSDLVQNVPGMAGA